MSMNQTPAANRVHIGIFGRRNAGKSSMINAMTGQNLAIVSDVAGTTTDPVYKTMELLPLGPVMMIDTPGLDDEGELGALRIKKAYQVLNKTDIAVLVIDAAAGMTAVDEALLDRIKAKNIPYVVVMNKSDLLAEIPETEYNHIYVSTENGQGIHELKELIAAQVPADAPDKKIAGDLIEPLDFVVLVVPIDSAAPKGRLILPQQQVIRDLLESDVMSVVVKETELEETLKRLGRKPKLVITDSQAFGKVSKITPPDIMLTSFSILFARYKGNLEEAVRGVTALRTLKDGDRVLISEGCTHHRQCEDIGTVKLPKWIREFTGREIQFDYTSGTEFPDDLRPYHMVVHCGGCMLNEREMKYRVKCAGDQRVPITNYGIAIAYIHGILARSLEPFPAIHALLEAPKQ
jgi:[FeFe] hydrogenase H-cluster maturation GTPase HydF